MNNEYVEKIHRVIDYIDKNPDDQLSLKELANMAGFSQYYFHRIFSAYVGETLSNFVKRIRLEKSAQILIYTNISITEVALSCGYETPSAYARAFRKFFGSNPSDYKLAKNYVSNMERNNAYHNMLKEIVMENFIEIREVEDQKVYYVRKTGFYKTIGFEGFDILFKFLRQKGIDTPDKNPNVKMIGICHDDPYVTDINNCRFDACITFTKDIKPEGEVGIQTLTGGKYAVFLHKGPYGEFGPVYQAICGEWIPNNSYKIRDLPMMEIYLNSPANTSPEDLLTEIYLPVE